MAFLDALSTCKNTEKNIRVEDKLVVVLWQQHSTIFHMSLVSDLFLCKPNWFKQAYQLIAGTKGRVQLSSSKLISQHDFQSNPECMAGYLNHPS